MRFNIKLITAERKSEERWKRKSVRKVEQRKKKTKGRGEAVILNFIVEYL